MEKMKLTEEQKGREGYEEERRRGGEESKKGKGVDRRWRRCEPRERSAGRDKSRAKGVRESGSGREEKGYNGETGERERGERKLGEA